LQQMFGVSVMRSLTFHIINLSGVLPAIGKHMISHELNKCDCEKLCEISYLVVFTMRNSVSDRPKRDEFINAIVWH